MLPIAVRNGPCPVTQYHTHVLQRQKAVHSIATPLVTAILSATVNTFRVAAACLLLGGPAVATNGKLA